MHTIKILQRKRERDRRGDLLEVRCPLPPSHAADQERETHPTHPIGAARRDSCYSDMNPMAKAWGFSVHPRGFCHESLKALPEPLNISRRVLVAIQDEPAVGADVSPHGEPLLHPFPTAATVLAGRRWGNRYHALAGACCLAG